jgi:hypothetical protein
MLLPTTRSVAPPVPEIAKGLSRRFNCALRKDNLSLQTTDPRYHLIPPNMPNKNERLRMPLNTCSSL